jgi:nitrogen regulatory protein PII
LQATGDGEVSPERAWNVRARRAGWRSRSELFSDGGEIMKLIKSIVRPHKVDDVRDALEKLSIAGMTVTDVRGHGRQKGHTTVYRGKEYSVSLLPKTQIEVVVPDEVVEEVIEVIIRAARTGEIGDGRVFVLPVEHSYNIRTGERDA